jgi:hypothetical protein
MNRLLPFISCVLYLALPAARATVAQPDTLDPVYFTYRDTFCADQLIFIGNSLYGPLQPSGTEVLPGAAASGADSIIVVELQFRQPSEIDYNPVVCENDTLWINGSPYHAEHWLGDEIIQGGAANGCDSIMHIELQLAAAPYRIVNDTLCPDDFMIVNGRRYDRNNRSGLEIIANGATSGCDSLVYLELEFRQVWLYLGLDREITIGETVCMEVIPGTTPVTVDWIPAPPCTYPLCTQGCVTPYESVQYQLHVTDIYGCELGDTLNIRVTDKNRVYAANVFRPGGAAEYANNFFYLSGDAGVVNVRRLYVADRWGSTVFDRQNIPPGTPDQGWDGRTSGQWAQPGVYVFWAELERVDGTTFRTSGSVTLVR